MLESLARFCYRRRRLVLLVWIVALFAVGALSGRLRGSYQTSFTLPSSDSQRAFSLLSDRFPALAGADARLVFGADDVRAPAVRAPLERLFGELRSFKDVAEVTSPYEPGSPGIASDGRTAFATIAFDRPGPELNRSAVVAVKHHVEAFRQDGVEIALGGNAVRFTERQGPGNEGIGVLAAVFILLITFGSVIAMGLPIMVAIFGLGIGIALIGLLTRFLEIPEFTPQLAAMIGLGVGIDYALFIVTRYRQALHAGAEPEQAIVISLTTAGRAVLFAGITVVISLMGMLLVGLKFIQGVAFGAPMTVLVTMIASVTLLPAVLGFCGHAIDRLRVPFLHRDESDHRASMWYRWSRVVQRKPLPAAIAGTLLLVLIAIPALSIRLGFSDEGNDPAASGSRRAYDMMAKGFGPGFNGPLVLAARVDGASQRTALNRLSLKISSVEGVKFAAPPRYNQARDTAVLIVIPDASPQSEETTALIERLRTKVIPSQHRDGDPAVYVGGITAAFGDLSDTMQSRLPVFVGGVVLLSFLLLLVVFRSVVIPLKAAVVNLLGISAAYGVTVAIFQWGWLSGVFGIEPAPIEPFLPMMLFAIVFGLSMDYEVFLMSRIREEYLRSGRNDIAVADGLAATARVITAAAAIMVTLFLSFVFGDQRVIKLFGLGLAVAIFLDATLIRMVIVPSFMELFGDTNWWLPRWLDRLVPRVSVEAAPEVDERPLEVVG